MLCSRSASLIRTTPDVVGHRDDHLAEILGLLFLAARKSDLRDLGHAVNQTRDLFPEEALNLVERSAGILNHVVQQPGND